MALLHFLNTVTLAAAVAVVGGAFEPSPIDRDPTAAEIAYADAPHGVDPMVTGPVSARFRQQREAAGCDGVHWPDVPLACYPE